MNLVLVVRCLHLRWTNTDQSQPQTINQVHLSEPESQEEEEIHFSMQDILDGSIYYYQSLHQYIEPRADFFRFRVSDGHKTSPIYRINVTITVRLQVETLLPLAHTGYCRIFERNFCNVWGSSKPSNLCTHCQKRVDCRKNLIPQSLYCLSLPTTRSRAWKQIRCYAKAVTLQWLWTRPYWSLIKIPTQPIWFSLWQPFLKRDLSSSLRAKFRMTSWGDWRKREMVRTQELLSADTCRKYNIIMKAQSAVFHLIRHYYAVLLQSESLWRVEYFKYFHIGSLQLNMMHKKEMVKLRVGSTFTYQVCDSPP